MSTIEPGNEFPCILSFSSFEVQPTPREAFPEIPLTAAFCESFEDVTGWTLGFKESKPSQNRRQQPGLSESPAVGELFINDMSATLPSGQPARHRGKCDKFVTELAELVHELQQTKLRLYATQAELATNSVTTRDSEANYRLAELLAALLDSAANSVGCQQAAIYLLDGDTEWLTMRASVGLGGKHIREIHRNLATSIADIEAMVKIFTWTYKRLKMFYIILN